jgi:hypothetical protein
MSSSSYDERGDQRPKAVIYDARETVQAARNEVWDELIGSGQVSLYARRNLATATIQYWDVLREHRDDRTASWDDSGVDQLASLVGETRQVPVSTPGDTAAVSYQEQPALLSIDPSEIIHISKQLDDYAKELGFAAQPDSGNRQTFNAGKRPAEEHNEPVKDTIARPQLDE